MAVQARQLISYIAPAAPATRRPASGDEAFLRPEVGFTPRWFSAKLGVHFGERWHTGPAYRRETVVAMRAELRRRFPAARIGGDDRPDRPLDLLTGTYGTCLVAGLYGAPIRYARDNWPDCERHYLSGGQVDAMTPPDLAASPLFQDLMRQVHWIAAHEGRVEGFINWQGVLNNAHRLRGEALLLDMLQNPGRARRLFECICTTMIDGARRLHARQRETGAAVGFFTVSNCLVNLISPRQYAEMLLPFDRRIAETFRCIGVHHCAGKADGYLDHYATIPHVAYIDMGPDSDLPRARRAFPHARRAVLYSPMDLARKPIDTIREDLARIARGYGPCDVVVADVDAGVPDERVGAVVNICAELSRGR